MNILSKIFIFLYVFSSVLIANENKIIVSSEYDYPPYEIVEDGNPSGFSIELIEEISKLMNLEIEVKQGIWNDIKNNLAEKKIDMIAGMLYSQERETVYGFSIPLTIVTYDIFFKENLKIKSIEDIKNKKIAISKGDLIEEYLIDNNISNSITGFESGFDALKSVNNGNHDLTIIPKVQGAYYIKKYNLNKVKSISSNIFEHKYCFAFHKDNITLLNKVNEGLNLLKQSGKYSEIYEKWFGVYEKNKFGNLLKYFFYISSIVFFFVLFVLLWIYTLKKQLHKKTKALKESEEHYRILYQRVPTGIITFDKNFIITHLNNKSIEILKSTYEKLYHLDLNKLKDNRIIPSLRTALEGKDGFYQGEYNTTTSLIKIYVKVKTTPFYNDKNQIEGGIIIIEDISKETEMFNKITEEQEKNKALLDAIPDIMFLIDEDGVYLDYHTPSQRNLLFEPKDFLGKNQKDILPYELSSVFSKAFEKIIKTETPQIVEYQLKLDDKQQYFEARIVKCGLNKLLVIVRDITEQKESKDLLFKEKEKLDTTLKSIGDGVITTDLKGNITLMNKIALNLCEWTFEEAKGKKLNEVFKIINEKTKQAAENPVDKVLLTGNIVGLANGTILITKTGKEVVIADSAAPIIDANGNIFGVVLVFRDVTEKTKMEKDLLKANKLESIGVFAGGIAHDFNNILTALLGNISLLKLELENNSELFNIANDVEKATNRAKDLTYQLLTFAKGGEPIKTISSMEDIIKDSASFVLRGSKTKCEFNFEQNLPNVEVDKGQISQVIQNIVINASHAMPNGGVVQTDVSVQKIQKNNIYFLSEGNYIKILIKDNGTGIKKENFDKIFDPYFTTKSNGSGLGLSVSYSIIKKHKGYIGFESEEGKGTTFLIFIPASEDKFKTNGDIKQYIKKGSGNILIMDDEIMIVETLQKMLKVLGYKSDFCQNGEEVILKYKNNFNTEKKFDAIIMDLTIPGGMGGKEAIENILNFDKNAIVIVSSGYSNDIIIANYKIYGFKAILNKPYQISELAEILNNLFLNKTETTK